jgi:uncharacterized membrane protein (DUF2068 family)
VQNFAIVYRSVSIYRLIIVNLLGVLSIVAGVGLFKFKKWAFFLTLILIVYFCYVIFNFWSVVNRVQGEACISARYRIQQTINSEKRGATLGARN